MWATELQPFFMGILVSVIVGIALTLPISSAAICAALGLTGLAGGAAVAGCCAQMVGFAVLSFRENGWGGLFAQGLDGRGNHIVEALLPALGHIPLGLNRKAGDAVAGNLREQRAGNLLDSKGKADVFNRALVPKSESIFKSWWSFPRPVHPSNRKWKPGCSTALRKPQSAVPDRGYGRSMSPLPC